MGERDEEFREFFEAEFRPLRRLAFLLTGDWGAAEDLAQEAMVRTYRSWGRIKERDRPGAYARVVLVNRHRSLLRRAMVETRHAVHLMPDPPSAPDLGEDHVVVWSALARLPVRQRQALVLRYYEDLPEAEIARAMECPIGTVKSLIHRALARMKTFVEEPSGMEREPS